MSGPAVRAVALAQVREVRARVGLPIVGMGGVQRGRHAHDLRLAGADLVAVGTESFRDPLAGGGHRRRTWPGSRPETPQTAGSTAPATATRRGP